MLARPRVRQLTLGELLDESFRLYRRDLLTLIALTALVIVPYTILNTLITIPFQQNIARLQNSVVPGTAPDQQVLNNLIGSTVYGSILSGTLGFVYAVVFVPIMEGALTRTVARRYLDHPVSIGDSIGGALRRALSLIVAKLLPSIAILALTIAFFACVFFGFIGVLVGNPFSSTTSGSTPSGTAIGVSFLLLFGSIILFLVVLAFMYVRILFTSQAVIAENKGPIEAIKRSWNLTKGYFWRTFGIFLLIALLAALIQFVPSGILGAIAGALTVRSGTIPDPVQQTILTSVIGAITSLLVTPFSLVAYTLMYYDLRIRKEGFDLEQQARALAPDANTGYTQPFNP